MARTGLNSDEMKVGTIQAYVVHFDQVDEAGFKWFDVLHSATDRLANYAALVDRRKPEFTHWIESTFDVHARHLLILDLIRIKPQYPGRGYSLYAAHSMINAFGVNGGVAACLPAPYELLKTCEEGILYESRGYTSNTGLGCCAEPASDALVFTWLSADTQVRHICAISLIPAPIRHAGHRGVSRKKERLPRLAYVQREECEVA